METSEPMRLDEILQAALAREEEARDFYSSMATGCRVEFVRELLEWLADEESKHVHLIQELITKLSLGKDTV